MFLMTTTTYPPDKTTEVAKVFMELPELPPFVKLLHVLVGSDLIAGYKVTPMTALLLMIETVIFKSVVYNMEVFT